MEILRVCAVGIITAILALFVKQYKSEFGILVTLCGGVVMLAMVVPYFGDVFSGIEEISESSGISGTYMKLIVKVIGITYIADYSCEICRDAGENALAAKLEMAGKVLILTMAFPVISAIYKTIVGLIP